MKHLTEEIVCIICGETFTRRATNKHTILCGKTECDVERRNDLNKKNQKNRNSGKKLEEKECVICGTLFPPKTRRSVCCSEECLYKNKIRKNKEAYHKDPAIKKDRIARSVEYGHKHPAWKAEQLRKWRKRHKRKYQAQNNEHRFGGNWLKTMDRNEWTCQGCDKEGVLVHHMDENNENNELTNLLTLCRSCHAVVHNFAERGFLEMIKKHGMAVVRSNN